VTGELTGPAQREPDSSAARRSALGLVASGLESPQSLDRHATALGNSVSAIDASGLCIPPDFIKPLMPAMVQNARGHRRITGPTIGPLEPGVTIPQSGDSSAPIGNFQSRTAFVCAGGAAVGANVGAFAGTIVEPGGGTILGGIGVGAASCWTGLVVDYGTGLIRSLFGG
jgi:hypothetical protein